MSASGLLLRMGIVLLAVASTPEFANAQDGESLSTGERVAAESAGGLVGAGVAFGIGYLGFQLMTESEGPDSLGEVFLGAAVIALAVLTGPSLIAFGVSVAGGLIGAGGDANYAAIGAHSGLVLGLVVMLVVNEVTSLDLAEAALVGAVAGAIIGIAGAVIGYELSHDNEPEPMPMGSGIRLAF